MKTLIASVVAAAALLAAASASAEDLTDRCGPFQVNSGQNWAGTYEGEWAAYGNTMKSAIVVTANGADGVKVLYANGPQPAWHREGGCRWATEASIDENGVLTFSFPDFGDANGTIVAQLGTNGEFTARYDHPKLDFTTAGEFQALNGDTILTGG